MRRVSLRAATLLFLSQISVACATDTEQLEVPAPDAHVFELQVYPILLRDCGFPACHGSRTRFFRIYGPGRTRKDESTPLFAPATAQELEHSYARTRSMLAHEGDLTEALLLCKPLARSAGGGGHKGTDNWGNNVYLRRDDPSYALLFSWAASAVDQP